MIWRVSHFKTGTTLMSACFHDSVLIEALMLSVFVRSYCLDEYATARRGTVVQGFIDALTRNGGRSRDHQQQYRPIELHAHDPIRYTGDILAWLHQSVASEKENLVQLLAECDKCQFWPSFTRESNRELIKNDTCTTIYQI